MYNVLKERVVPQMCGKIPLRVWHRLSGVELLLPFYHTVSDDEREHVSCLYEIRNTKQFKADLEFFLRYYVPVKIHDIIQYLDGLSSLPKRSFLLTFDDGFREVYDTIAPILLAKGVPAVFFLTTSVIDNHTLAYPQKKSLLLNRLALRMNKTAKQEVLRRLADEGFVGSDLNMLIRSITYRNRSVLDLIAPFFEQDFVEYANSAKPYLTSEQIRELIQEGFDIGSHSVDHPNYWELSVEDQLTQTRKSMLWLSNHFHTECRAFAFPFGDKGVSSVFFEKAFADEDLKLSFGTGNMFPHFFSKNLERFGMEKGDLSAKQILSRVLARIVFLA